MINPDTVPVPARLAGFPKWQGYLVHFTVWTAPDGTPDFRVVHEARRVECMRKRLCALCGHELEQPLVFIGGPLAEQSRLFMDGPMHEECAMYATKTCPYIADANYQARPLDKSHERVEAAGERGTVVDAIIPGRPARMMLYYTDDYRLASYRGTTLYLAGEPIKLDWTAMPQRQEQP